jgi:hypothetical protein
MSSLDSMNKNIFHFDDADLEKWIELASTTKTDRMEEIPAERSERS